MPANKKTKPVLYLAGPIKDRSDEQCKEWRAMITASWTAFATLDPTRRMARGREHEQEVMERIVRQDKLDIDRCNAVLVYWDGTPSVGTSMEVLYAHQRGKPVVVAAPGVEDPASDLSLWLRYHSTSIQPTFEGAHRVLSQILAHHIN